VPKLKTKPTACSVRAYLDTIGDEHRRQDCEALLSLMQRVTGHEPKMWGPSIVGFGSYHYKYASGHEGDACLVGFSSRAGAISLYVMAGFEGREQLLAALGKHRIGKACLYVTRTSDISLPVLEELVANSVAEIKRRYP